MPRRSACTAVRRGGHCLNVGSPRGSARKRDDYGYTVREKNWAREDAWARGVRWVQADELGIKNERTLSHVGPAKMPSDTEIRAISDTRTLKVENVYD